MNDKGFIILWRKMIESWVWCLSDADFRLAVTCLVLANWKEGKWFDGKEMLSVERGSFVTTIQKLQVQLGKESTEKKIRGGLKRLAAAEFLSWGKGKGKRYTHITIVNYSQYQDKPDEAAVEKQSKGQESAGDGQSDGSREAVERATIEQLNKQTQEQNNNQRAVENRILNEANSILVKLNADADKRFQPNSKSDRLPIVRALTASEDEPAVPVAELALIIEHRCALWLGTEQEKYLRPITLFEPKYLSGYRNDARKWHEAGRPSRNDKKDSGVRKIVDWSNVGTHPLETPVDVANSKPIPGKF